MTYCSTSDFKDAIKDKHNSIDAKDKTLLVLEECIEIIKKNDVTNEEVLYFSNIIHTMLRDKLIFMQYEYN